MKSSEDFSWRLFLKISSGGNFEVRNGIPWSPWWDTLKSMKKKFLKKKFSKKFFKKNFEKNFEKKFKKIFFFFLKKIFSKKNFFKIFFRNFFIIFFDFFLLEIQPNDPNFRFSHPYNDWKACTTFDFWTTFW